jgi:endonuclease G
MRAGRVAIALAWLAFCNTASAEILQLNYEGFTVWVDCDRRGPILFHYMAQADSGSFPRHSSYYRDPNVPVRCQSTDTGTFGHGYDVGHQVPANHFDGSEVAILQTNFWTNLLPQTASMNRGAWLQTEYIIECLRDEVPLEVWGGPIWGENPADDYFTTSHGIATPDAFWKVAIRTDNREAMAWVVPNGPAPGSSLNKWLVSIATIEAATGLPFDAVQEDVVPSASWERPAGCSVQ